MVDRVYTASCQYTMPGSCLTVPLVNGDYPYEWKRTALQMAELKSDNGMLTCDRDAPFRFWLEEPDNDSE